MMSQTSIKAGAISINHNETQVRTRSLPIKTRVKAGRVILNHNQRQIRTGLAVKTGLKAGQRYKKLY